MPSASTPSDLPSRPTHSSSFPWSSPKRRRSGPSSSSPPKPPSLRTSSFSRSQYDSLVDSSFASEPHKPDASQRPSHSPTPWPPSSPQQDLNDPVPWTLPENLDDSDEDWGTLRTGGGRRGMMRERRSTASSQVPSPPARPRVAPKLDSRLRKARSTLGFHHRRQDLPPSPRSDQTSHFLDPYGSHFLPSSSNTSSITITAPPSPPRSSDSPPSSPTGSFGSDYEVVEIGHRGGVLEGVKWGTRRGASTSVEVSKWEEEVEEDGWEGRGDEGEEYLNPIIDPRW